MGAGRTELLETLFGVYPPPGHGPGPDQRQAAAFNSPEEAIAAGLAFVTEDRKNQSLIVRLSVAHNMTLAALKRFLSIGFIQFGAREQAVTTRSSSCISRRRTARWTWTRCQAAINRKSPWPNAC